MDGSSSTPAKGGSGAKGGRKKATTSPKQKEGGDGRGRKQKKDGVWRRKYIIQNTYNSIVTLISIVSHDMLISIVTHYLH